MTEPQSKVIGGVTYEVYPLGFGQARSLFVRLFRVAGPAVAQTVMAAAQGGGLGDLGDKDVMTAVEAMADRLTEEDFKYVCDVLANQTMVSGAGKLSEVEENHWRGRFAEMFQWLGFALQVNYAGFFSGPDDEQSGAAA